MENFKDLRDWLREIEKMGELKTINEEVDWDEEPYTEGAWNTWQARGWRQCTI